jgi:hypothetical protein
LCQQLVNSIFLASYSCAHGCSTLAAKTYTSSATSAWGHLQTSFMSIGSRPSLFRI